MIYTSEMIYGFKYKALTGYVQAIIKLLTKKVVY